MTTERIGHALPARRGLALRLPENWEDYALAAPGALFLIAFMIFPLVYNIDISFRDLTLFTMLQGGSYIGLRNYELILGDPLFWRSVRVTLVFTAACLVIQMLAGFALALFFNRAFPGRNLFRALFLLAWMIPVIISATLFGWMLNPDFGIINHLLQVTGLTGGPIRWVVDPETAILAIILVKVWTAIPVNMMILLAGLQTLPGDVYEAAAVDGVSRPRQFLHITLPLMRPTVLILLMLNLIYTFKAFDLILVLTGGGPVDSTTVMQFYAYKQAFTLFDFGKGAAASNLVLVILIVLAVGYLHLQRKEEGH